jgi:hypothetical protein
MLLMDGPRKFLQRGTILFSLLQDLEQSRIDSEATVGKI